MNDSLSINPSYIKKIISLNNQRKTMSFSNSPKPQKTVNLKKSIRYSHQFQPNLTFFKERLSLKINKSPIIKDYNTSKNISKLRKRVIFCQGLGNEKIKMKRILSDLISFDNKNTVDSCGGKNKRFDLKNFKIPGIKQNKIISQELIPLIKFRESAKRETNEILKNEKRLNLIKLKYSIFDKDFDNEKFKDEEKRINESLKNNNIETSTQKLKLEINKRIQKTNIQKEIKNKESLYIVHKKLTMNKLKKIKYIELLNETYHLVDNARIDTNLSIDILNERINYIKKFYAVYIDLFKGYPVKLLEEIIREIENYEKEKEMEKEREKEMKKENENEKYVSESNDNDEGEESVDESEKKNKIKNEISSYPKHPRIKYKKKFRENIRMYREYKSIQEDIVNEIKNYEKKFNDMKSQLDDIIINIRRKIEEINDDSKNLKLIQKKLSQKQIKYYLKKLKKGTDIRYEGLSWIVTRLIELNAPIDHTIFPDFLDLDQINYIIQISKYSYEVNQLKILLDCLREKETGKANSNLKIFSNLTEESLLSKFLFNNVNMTEDNKSDNIHFNKNKNIDKILLKLMQSNPLLSKKNYETMRNEHKKIQIENKFIDLKFQESKRRLSFYAIDKQSKLNSKINSNNNINKMILLQNDKKSEYFCDILKIIEKINNLNNLLNERREKELINFSEKFKIKDLQDEEIKSHYNKAFNALFGNSTFHFTEK